MKVDINNAFYYLNVAISRWNENNELNDGEPFVYIKIFKKIRNRMKLLLEVEERHKQKLKESSEKIKELHAKIKNDIDGFKINKIDGAYVTTKTKKTKRKKKYGDGEEAPIFEKDKFEIVKVESYNTSSHFIPNYTNMYCVLEIDEEPIESISEITPMEKMLDYGNNTSITIKYKDSSSFNDILKEHTRELRIMNGCPKHSDDDTEIEIETVFSNMISDKSSVEYKKPSFAIKDDDMPKIEINEIPGDDKVTSKVQMDFYIYNGEIDIKISPYELHFNILGVQKPIIFLGKYINPITEDTMEQRDNFNDSDSDLTDNQDTDYDSNYSD
jgi:hypothetical protein